MNKPVNQTINRVSRAGETPAGLRGGVVAIGNFDGVHRGHRAVLDRALAVAEAENIPALVLTFEPHPRTFFRPDQPVPRLTPANLKAELLGEMGFDGVVEHPFNKDTSGMAAEEFVSEILVGALGATHVVTGYDFHFGKNRTGTPQFLVSKGADHGFKVELVDAFTDENAEVISSSRIRTALAEGDLALANGLLGYPFRVSGVVEKGRQVGRELGFPTANIALAPETSLKQGIYAVRVKRPDGTLHDGVASYGRRPTFDDGAPLFETWLMDFSGDLYGEEHTVSIHAYLRGEEKFDSVDDLIGQMKLDAEEARAFLATVPVDQVAETA